MLKADSLPIRTSAEMLALAPAGATGLIVASHELKKGEITSITRRVAVGWQHKTDDGCNQLRDASAKFKETEFLALDPKAECKDTNGHFLKGKIDRATGWVIRAIALTIVKCWARYEDAITTIPIAVAQAVTVPDNPFQSLVSSPGQLRKCELDRILNLANESKSIHAFLAWLLKQELQPDTRNELAKRAPNGADGAITFYMQNGDEIKVLVGGVALRIRSLAPKSVIVPTPVIPAKPVIAPEPVIAQTLPDVPGFIQLAALAVSRKVAFEGNCAAPESAFITDGRAMFVKSACDIKFAQQKPIEVGRYGPKNPVPDASLKKLFDGTVEQATVEAQIWDYALASKVEGHKNDVETLACLTTAKHDFIIVCAHKLRFAQRNTGADSVRVAATEPEKHPVLLLKAGQPAAVIMVVTKPEAVASFKKALLEHGKAETIAAKPAVELPPDSPSYLPSELPPPGIQIVKRRIAPTRNGYVGVGPETTITSRGVSVKYQ